MEMKEKTTNEQVCLNFWLFGSRNTILCPKNSHWCHWGSCGLFTNFQHLVWTLNSFCVCDSFNFLFELPAATLIVHRDKSQFFQYDSISLMCATNTSGWTLKKINSSKTFPSCDGNCTLSYAMPYDTGLYRCQSDNGAGAATRSTSQWQVQMLCFNVFTW